MRVDLTVADDFVECLYEANPNGGLANQHGRLCYYKRSCCRDAVVHIRVLDTAWCGNVCAEGAVQISKQHRVKAGKVRVNNSEENLG